jgi:hypothetical protein
MGATRLTRRGVETFAPGVHPGDEPGEVWRYSERDVRGILYNFRRLSTGPRPLHRVPVILTHDGVRAHGWVTAAYLGPDGRRILLMDWDQVSPHLDAGIDSGRYKLVSPEIKPDFMDRQGRHYGPYLYRVAVLGADVPRQKGLAPIPARQHADPQRGRRFVRALKFAEVRTMADTATVDDKRTSVGDYYGLPQDLIDSLSDEQVEMGATAILKDAAGGGGEGGGGEEAAPMADSASMSREELIAELTALGEDPAALEAMSDDELRALYDQLTGGGTAPMSEPNTRKTPALTQKLADPAFVRRTVNAAVRQGLATIGRATKAADDAQRKREADEEARRRDAKCRTFGDEMVRVGIWTPADVDESNPRVLCKLQQLLRLDDTRVRTFSEGGKEHKTTDLDAAMEEIRRQKPRKFGERVAAGGAGNDFQAIHKLAEEMHAARKAGGSRTLEEKLGMLPPRGVR